MLESSAHHVQLVERADLQVRRQGWEQRPQRLGDANGGAAAVGDQQRQAGDAGQQQLDAPRDVEHVVCEACGF